MPPSRGGGRDDSANETSEAEASGDQTNSQEVARLREKLRMTEEELAETREERDELTEDLATLERKDRQGAASRRSVGAGSSTATEQRERIEKLEEEMRSLRLKNKDLIREAGRKDEIINTRSQSLEEQRTTMQSERDERRQLEEDVRVMRTQIRDYRDKLENTNDSVMAREERNREGNKQLRQKTREINQLLSENASLRRDLKERDDDLQELAVSLPAHPQTAQPPTDALARRAVDRTPPPTPPPSHRTHPPRVCYPQVTVEKLKTDKAEADLEGEESARLVNSLERQVSSAEATEVSLQRKIEELQAEMDEEEEANEEEKRDYERLIAELQKAVGEHKKAIDERDIKIGALEADAERRTESREQLALRSEIEALKLKLDTKDDEVEAARRGEAEGSDRTASIQAAVRAAESAGAQKLVEASKKAATIEGELKVKLDELTTKFDGSKKRYSSLSEKFAQREDVIVELRARMDEYERGVHGLREEVQEKERFKALHEERCDEVKRMV